MTFAFKIGDVSRIILVEVVRDGVIICYVVNTNTVDCLQYCEQWQQLEWKAIRKKLREGK